MSKRQKKYLFICDFDKTLSFDDSGVILSEKIGINEETFEEKLVKVRTRNIVQLGGELAQLIVTDPDYKGKVSKKLFKEVAKDIKLKRDVSKLMKVLEKGIEENKFYCYVISACPVEIIKTALKGILPPENIIGTTFIYDDKGVVQCIERTGDLLREKNKIPRDRIIYVGDGSSDLHVMLHVNAYGGYPIAVSSSPYLGHISKRTVLSDSALSILTPILEDILGYKETQIKKFFIDIGHTISEWSRVKTDWIALE
jgi:2-hydroxy-3-keto-5-methylthiopentenyl-1-phosphate phosphatase